VKERATDLIINKLILQSELILHSKSLLQWWRKLIYKRVPILLSNLGFECVQNLWNIFGLFKKKLIIVDVQLTRPNMKRNSSFGVCHEAMASQRKIK
jgi:hypothetical protein